MVPLARNGMLTVWLSSGEAVKSQATMANHSWFTLPLGAGSGGKQPVPPAGMRSSASLIVNAYLRAGGYVNAKPPKPFVSETVTFGLFWAPRQPSPAPFCAMLLNQG